MKMQDFGKCPICGENLEPVYFQEDGLQLYEGSVIETGRVRTIVDYLVCPHCDQKQIVDDSFDGPWRSNI